MQYLHSGELCLPKTCTTHFKVCQFSKCLKYEKVKTANYVKNVRIMVKIEDLNPYLLQ